MKIPTTVLLTLITLVDFIFMKSGLSILLWIMYGFYKMNKED